MDVMTKQYSMFGLIFWYFLHTKNKCGSLFCIPGQNGQSSSSTSLLAYWFLYTLRLLIPSLREREGGRERVVCVCVLDREGNKVFFSRALVV